MNFKIKSPTSASKAIFNENSTYVTNASIYKNLLRIS